MLQTMINTTSTDITAAPQLAAVAAAAGSLHLWRHVILGREEL